MLEPFQLSADTTVITLQGPDQIEDRDFERGPYQVQFDAGPNIILAIGATLKHASAKWEHPNIVAKTNDYLEFKHYNDRTGHKWWTASAGVKFFLVIPKTQFALVRKCGYSWPEFIINGQKFTLNVSGGTSGGGWVDSVRGVASTSCNLPRKALLTLAEVALTPEQCREQGVTLANPGLSDYQIQGWIEKCAQADTILTPGMKVQLVKGYTFGGSGGPFPFVQMRKRSFILDVGTYGRTSEKFIDWTETAKLNGIPLRDPKAGEFNLIPAPVQQAA